MAARDLKAGPLSSRGSWPFRKASFNRCKVCRPAIRLDLCRCRTELGGMEMHFGRIGTEVNVFLSILDSSQHGMIDFLVLSRWRQLLWIFHILIGQQRAIVISGRQTWIQFDCVVQVLSRRSKFIEFKVGKSKVVVNFRLCISRFDREQIIENRRFVVLNAIQTIRACRPVATIRASLIELTVILHGLVVLAQARCWARARRADRVVVRIGLQRLVETLDGFIVSALSAQVPSVRPAVRYKGGAMRRTSNLPG